MEADRTDCQRTTLVELNSVYVTYGKVIRAQAYGMYVGYAALWSLHTFLALLRYIKKYR